MDHETWAKVELVVLWALNYFSTPSNILLWLTIAYTAVRLIGALRDQLRGRP